MNIGLYHDAVGTRHAGGIAVYIQHVAAELGASNDVYVYTQRGETTELLANADVTLVETPAFADRIPALVDGATPLGRQDWSKLLMTQWAARHGVVDHIDDHVDVLLTFQFLDDLLLSHLVEPPTVYEYHSLEQVGVGATLRERFSRTEHVLANADDTARRVADEFGYDVDGVIYPGVDAERFRPDGERAFSSDRPTILFVGRFVESKGVFDLLSAVRRLERPVRLHLVGTGATARVEQRCRELGLEEVVTIHGEIPHLELPRYYRAADVFCLPTHAESFGMVNVEAMACGTPVVTTDLEGTRAYVDNGGNGLLVTPRDPIDLADKLRMLLEAPGRRAEMGRLARERALQFTWAEQAARLERVCADVIGAKTGGRSADGRVSSAVAN
ncbi:glycosyltransferase family 4 protein [Natrononativus amylolyticus]|uniref:glycosyltransferase family 4 protein n=1 Tax=Natrononativus amylolyticus TaxID=2963434 RepID=UPI0020CCFC5B|nr:glycosyltransferase family 4 protein [Natrononativus amylolyticus]